MIVVDSNRCIAYSCSLIQILGFTDIRCRYYYLLLVISPAYQMEHIKNEKKKDTDRYYARLEVEGSTCI